MAFGFGNSGSGSTDKLTLSTPQLSASGVTFAWWWRRQSDGMSTAYGRLVDQAGSAVIYNNGAGYNYSRAGFYHDSGTLNIANWNRPSTNVWEHVVLTYDGTSSVPVVWVNGSDISVWWSSAFSGSTWDRPSGVTMYVGNNAAGDRCWDGDIAEVAMWGRILSNSEKSALYKGYSALFFPQDLQVYVPMVRQAVELISGVCTPTGPPLATEHRPIIYPSNEIVKPPKKGKIWVNDSPSWDSGAVLQKHPGKPTTGIPVVLASQSSLVDTSTITLSSVSPTANAKVLVAVYTQMTTVEDGDPTVSGLGATWTQREETTAFSDRGLRVWEAHETSWAAGDIVISAAGTDVINYYNAVAVEITGADSSGVVQTTSDNLTSGAAPNTVSSNFATPTNQKNTIMFFGAGSGGNYFALPQEGWTILDETGNAGTSALVTHYIVADSETKVEGSFYNGATSTRKFLVGIEIAPSNTGWTDTAISVGQEVDILTQDLELIKQSQDPTAYTWSELNNSQGGTTEYSVKLAYAPTTINYGVVNKLGMYLDTLNTANFIKLIIRNSEGTLLGSGVATYIGGDFYEADIPDVPVIPGEEYILSYIADTGYIRNWGFDDTYEVVHTAAGTYTSPVVEAGPRNSWTAATAYRPFYMYAKGYGDMPGPHYLGIQAARRGTTDRIKWIPITIDKLDIAAISEDDDVLDNEIPWVITGVGFGDR